MDAFELFSLLLLKYIIPKSAIRAWQIPNSLHFWAHFLFIFWHTINIKIQAWKRWEQQKSSKRSEMWSTNAGRPSWRFLVVYGDWIQCHLRSTPHHFLPRRCCCCWWCCYRCYCCCCHFIIIFSYTIVHFCLERIKPYTMCLRVHFLNLF